MRPDSSSAVDSDTELSWDLDLERGEKPEWQQWDWLSEQVPAVSYCMHPVYRSAVC